MRTFRLILGLALAGQLHAAVPGVESRPFGKTRAGEDVQMHILRNRHGLTAKLITFGAIIYALEVPTQNGAPINLTANCESVQDYEQRSPGFGAIIGRYANRIAGARFAIDDKEIEVTRNAGKHHIHGGHRGFAKVVWQTTRIDQEPNRVAVQFTYISKDGEEGFPGEVKCRVTYALNDQNELRMEYEAVSTKPTHLNVCNHAYWNLAGAYSGDILQHQLTVNADDYLLVDADLIPTGGFAEVEHTPLDFRQPHRIGERIGLIKGKQFGGGYDHCLVIKRAGPNDLAFCARLSDPSSGRSMEVWTTEPGVQLYSANFGSGSFVGPNGYSYPRHLGFCLETQHYPDSPNRPEFPSTLLRPGQVFRSTTVHKFSWPH